MAEMVTTNDHCVLIGSFDETQSLQNLANHFGYNTTCFTSGLEILAFLKTTTPQLMFLDANLPVLNGTSIVERAKKLARLRSVPAIVLVDAFNPKQRAQADWCRADRIIYKPLQAQEIAAVLQTFQKTTQVMPYLPAQAVRIT